MTWMRTERASCKDWQEVHRASGISPPRIILSALMSMPRSSNHTGSYQPGRIRMISRQSIITVSREQVSCDLAGEAAILNLSDGVYYGLNEVGAAVWKMLQKPVTVDEICLEVMNQFDVDAGRCEQDVVSLLEDLQAKGLIEVSERSGA